MFKKILGACLMIISVLSGLFTMIYGKAIFWCAVVTAKVNTAALGGFYSILAWVIIILGLTVGSVFYGCGKIDKQCKEKIKELKEEIDKI